MAAAPVGVQLPPPGMVPLQVQPQPLAGPPVGADGAMLAQPPMQPGYAPMQPQMQQPQAMQQPPPPTQAAQPPGAAGGLALGDPNAMQALLRQVMSLTDEQIAALAPEHRQQVLFVKDQVMSGKLQMQ